MTMFLGGALLPHPPILLPAIGQGREKEAAATLQACGEAAREIASWEPDVLVLISPHAPSKARAVAVNASESLKGSLRAFGFPQEEQCWNGASELAKSLVTAWGRGGISCQEQEQELDHGALVPLYFLAQAGCKAKVVTVSFGALAQRQYYEMGQMLRRLILAGTQRVAVIASGDLSHRVTRNAPAGYHPAGEQFDKQVVAALGQGDAETLLHLPWELQEEAGECGLRSILFLLGACGPKPSVRHLSYEAPFGVGYAVTLVQENPQLMLPVDLAWRSIRCYLQQRTLWPVPSELAEEWKRPGAAFVSLKKEGMLRGCIGTFAPTQPSLAAEIIRNAVLAATEDPRFEPVREEELQTLQLSVDVLSEPEKVASETQLDPKEYGVIVQQGPRRGLLLPDLEGVDTVEEQLRIAKRKAGIAETAAVELFRFRVCRYGV